MELKGNLDSRHYREGSPSSLLSIACRSFRRDIPPVPLFAETSSDVSPALFASFIGHSDPKTSHFATQKTLVETLRDSIATLKA
jgi:hypothetical protein